MGSQLDALAIARALMRSTSSLEALAANAFNASTWGQDRRRRARSLLHGVPVLQPLPSAGGLPAIPGSPLDQLKAGAAADVASARGLPMMAPSGAQGTNDEVLQVRLWHSIHTHLALHSHSLGWLCGLGK